MFWGKGDTSELEEREQATLADLRRMVETGHIIALSPEQTDVAKRAFDFYGKWESAFAAMGSLRNVLLLIAGGMAFWWATGGENFITDFIRKAVE